jgi:hypothetical protein
MARFSQGGRRGSKGETTMKTTMTSLAGRLPLPVLGVALALALAFSSPALADGGRHRHHHHRHGHHSHDVRIRPIAVPQFIHPARVHLYQPYYRVGVYYPRHAHVHAVYHFPVWADGAVIQRPYSYCGDRLFVGGQLVYDGPRFSLGVRF